MASKPLARSSSAASNIFRPGVLVEISNYVKGFQGSWFTGKIIRCLHGDEFYVKYDKIMEKEDKTKGLREKAKLSQLRPIPPKDIVHDFRIGDDVDAYHNGGWWEGWISGSSGDGKWVVDFYDWKERQSYPERKLRLHHNWVNGRWIRPIPQQHNRDIKKRERVRAAETASREKGDFIRSERVDKKWVMTSKHEVAQKDRETKLNLEEECQELKRYFSTLDIVGKRMTKKKVRELTHSFTISMCLPSVKYTLRREIKKRKKSQESDVHRDPSMWKYAEGSQESQTMKRLCTKPTESHLSSKSLRHYLSQFPIFLHQYIDDIIDVRKDGNCGFRAIAALLGMGEQSWPLVREQLDVEVYQHHQLYSKVFHDTISNVRSSLQVDSLGPQDCDKWMMIPEMGYPIASRYNVIFVSLSKNFHLNLTFFPLMRSPCTTESIHEIFAVGFVDNDHWVQVKLKPNCPLPPITDQWRQNCSEDARAWETTYARRIRHWEEEVQKST
ncbi:uncharacterized protein LOC131615792 [Vicia villosa]|uniref:uncharacterized protein LOC131615792 n=1 Tax=Vicia villosa TaxID=3911 RepID=UPI00273C0365|nr:uncharacterized protein LOC131615792 [Vicia villosa]